MSKRPHTKYDKTDKEIEELVNNQLNPTPDYKQEIEGILGTVYKRVAGKDYTTGNGGLSNIYYEDCTYKLTQALTHLIETEKKKAYSKGYRNGFAQGQFDKEMNDKYPPEELQGEVE